MNDESPAGRGSRRRPGGMQEQGSEGACRSSSDDEGDLRFEIRGRLHAVLQELDVQPPDWDVIATLLAGAVESIEAQS